MITKHRVSNDIVVMGETDVAPPLLRIREKENVYHNGTDASSSDITNIGVVFDAPQTALNIHTKNNGRKYK